MPSLPRRIAQICFLLTASPAMQSASGDLPTPPRCIAQIGTLLLTTLPALQSCVRQPAHSTKTHCSQGAMHSTRLLSAHPGETMRGARMGCGTTSYARPMESALRSPRSRTDGSGLPCGCGSLWVSADSLRCWSTASRPPSKRSSVPTCSASTSTCAGTTFFSKLLAA